MIAHIPAIIKVLLVFAAILVAIRYKVSLGTGFVGGAVLLGLLFRQSPMAIAGYMVRALVEPKTLALAAVVCLILILSHGLEKAGQMERLLARFRGLIRHSGLNLAIFPALIGLLPMPGGAVFSAPMVKTLGGHHNLTSEQLSFINYWYRHIWEFFWPLYPGVLLSVSLAGLDFLTFVLAMMPLTLVSIAVGYLPLKRIRWGSESPANSGGTALGPFVHELLPILIVIVPGLLLGTLFSYLFSGIFATVAKETGLIIALILSVAYVFRINAIPRVERWEILKNKHLVRMFYMVAAIMIFKGVLTDSGAVDAVGGELVSWRIPLLSIAILMPFLIGMVSGITVAFVGTTFPIIISLVHAMGESHLMMPYMMLSLTSGFAGVLLSPLHLCLMLSNHYFRASLNRVYRQLIVPSILLCMAAIIYFFILNGLAG